jgi:hypothetical protein
VCEINLDFRSKQGLHRPERHDATIEYFLFIDRFRVQVPASELTQIFICSFSVRGSQRSRFTEAIGEEFTVLALESDVQVPDLSR